MAKELLLAIDVGTQSTRALIFDLQGDLLFKTKIPLPVYNAPKPGWAELDPQRFWESLCQACQRLWATPGVEKDQIAGVAITTQRNVLITSTARAALCARHPLVRPAPHFRLAKRGRGLGLALCPFGHDGHHPLPASGSQDQLGPHVPTGNLEQNRQNHSAFGLSDLPYDRTIQGFNCLPGGASALRL